MSARAATAPRSSSLPGTARCDLGLDFSDDGRYLAVQDPARSRLHVWRLDGEASERILSEPSLGWITRFSPDSRQIALQPKDGVVGILDLAKKTRVTSLAAGQTVYYLAFHPSGGQLALSCTSSVQVRDLKSGKTTWDRNVERQLTNNCVKWHPDGKVLALMDADAICFWDVTTDKQTAIIKGIQEGGTHFSFNPAGTLLASRNWGGILRLWDPLSGRLLFSTPADAEAVQFSSDGRILAATAKRNHLRLWQVASASEYRTLAGNPAHPDRPFSSVVVNAAGTLVAAGGPRGQASLWELQSGKELCSIADPSGWNLVAFQPGLPGPGAAEMTHEAWLTMTSSGLFSRPIVLDATAGSVSVGNAQKMPGLGENCRFALSRDGKVLASARVGGAVVWHADQPDRLVKLGIHYDARTISISPNGAWVVTGRFGYPGGLKVWHANTGKLKTDLPLANHSWSVFSPDGQRMLSSGHNSFLNDYRIVRRWEVATWTELPFPEPLEGTYPSFAPNGKTIVLETGSAAARLVDAETGREIACLEDPNQHRTSEFAFTPDGSKLLARHRRRLLRPHLGPASDSQATRGDGSGLVGPRSHKRLACELGRELMRVFRHLGCDSAIAVVRALARFPRRQRGGLKPTLRRRSVMLLCGHKRDVCGHEF